MKKYLLLFLLVASPAFALDVTFQWDLSPGDPEGYRLLQGKRGGPYTQRAQVIHPTNTVTVTYDMTGGRCWVARAYDGSIESGNSNEVCLQPVPPGLLRFAP